MKRFFSPSVLLTVLMLLIIFSLSVGADMGPKPSVVIEFENMGDQPCYGTLLSKNPSTGPYSVWSGDAEDAIHNGNEYYEYTDITEDLWRAFVEYEDTDGYYFLQEAIWQVNAEKRLAWTYYPPDSFKVLLYYPETDEFAVSGICEKYAFDTYYTVDMSGIQIGSVDYNDELSSDERLNAYRSYQWTAEALSLAVRILATVAVEVVIALALGIRGKRVVCLLLEVNAVTQLLLNGLLNTLGSRGEIAVIYILAELGVLALEALIYSASVNRISDKKRPKLFYWIYSLIANTASFISGLLISQILPSMF